MLRVGGQSGEIRELDTGAGHESFEPWLARIHLRLGLGLGLGEPIPALVCLPLSRADPDPDPSLPASTLH